MNWGIATRSGTIPLDRWTPTPTPVAADETETTAWVAAVVTAGGTVSAGRKTAVNNFIIGLKADGLWAKLDRYWLFASEGSAPATLVDIRNLQPALAVNSPTLAASGYTFNGSNNYVDTQFNPFSGGVLFVQNSAHGSVWSVTTPVWALMGHLTGVAGFEIAYYSGQWQWTQGPNDQQTVVATGASTATGLACVTRTASNARAHYLNGASIASDAGASTGVPNQNIFVGGISYLGGMVHGTTNQIAACSLGSGLNSTDNTNFYNRQRTLMTACGVP